MIEKMNIPYERIYIYDYQDKYPEFVQECDKKEWDSYTTKHKEFMLKAYFDILEEYGGDVVPKNLFELSFLIANGV